MEMILEGVDSLDVSLIMEANGEFKKGFASLKDNLTGFIAVCKPFGELSNFTANLEKSLQSINGVESNMDKISDEYSFTDHLNMANPSKDESEKPPEAIVSSIALEYPTYVAALRDAILEIAKWLEQYPEVFSVGKNGIAFSEKFKGVIKNNDLKIKDFGQSGDEIISLMSGIQDTTPEKSEIKSHFETVWKTENLEEEKYDEAWEKFVAAFDTISQGATAAHDSASNIIKGVKPPEAIQNTGKESGGILQTVIGALFGGKKEASSVEPISQDPSLIIGASLTDEKGIFAMSFQDLQKLIASVIEFSGTSSAAGAQALAGIDSQQQEAMNPNKEEAAIVKKIQGASPKIDDKIVTQTGAALEQSGMKDGDTSKVDVEKLKKILMDQSSGDEDKVKALLDALELEGGDGESSDVYKPPSMSTKDVKTGLGNAEKSNLNSDARKLITKALGELELVTLQEAYKSGQSLQTIVDDIIAAIEKMDLKGKEKNAFDKIKKELQDGRPGRDSVEAFVKDQLKYVLAERKSLRWSLLAGINMDN